MVEKSSYQLPAVFRLMQEKGNLDEKMMYNTYNMGIGMTLALAPSDGDKAIEALKAAGENAFIIGRMEAGEKGVEIC